MIYDGFDENSDGAWCWNYILWLHLRIYEVVLQGGFTVKERSSGIPVKVEVARG